MLVKITYKQACDCVSKVQVAVPSKLILCQSSGKVNGLENINDVVHSATAYTYKTLANELQNHHCFDNWTSSKDLILPKLSRIEMQSSTHNIAT